MLLKAYQVQIAGHMIRIGILCWLDVINQKIILILILPIW
jgi:hypothetical protein